MIDYLACALVGLLLHWLVKLQGGHLEAQKHNTEFYMGIFLHDNWIEMIISGLSVIGLFLILDTSKFGAIVIENMPYVFHMDNVIFLMAGFFNSAILFSLVRLFKGIFKTE